MALKKTSTTKPIVAVFGGTGHTGRFVIAELLRRGMTPIAVARSAEALATAHFSTSDVICRQATVDDAASLDHALHGAQAVINCAGPFVDTADAVASAALRAGMHYVDVAAEQVSASQTLEKFDEPARQAGVAVIPAMAYFGGLTDLMTTAALGEWDAVDAVDVMIGFDRWQPTLGTRNTIARKSVGNLMVTGGRLAEVPTPPAQKRWHFAEPVADQAVVELPFAEVVLIARHVKTTELHTYLTQVAVSDVLDPATPPPQAADAMGRSAQNFVVEVVVTRGKERRRAIARGRDGYAVTAPLACEAVERLLTGQFRSAGAHAPGEIFDAKAILASLGPDYTFDIVTEKPGTIVTYPEDLKWEAVGPLDDNGKGIFVSLLYGDLKTKGPTNFLMKYSAGVTALPHIHSGDYYAVVVSGEFRHFLESENEYKVLTTGATWFQKGNVVHQDCCVGPEDCILNIFWPQGFDVAFVKETCTH